MAVHVNGQVTVPLAQFRDGVSRRAGPSIQHPLPLELVPYTEALSTNLFDRGRLPAHRCAQNRMVCARQPARQPVIRAARGIVRRGITSWLACRPVALGCLESDNRPRGWSTWVPRVGWPGKSKSYGEPRRTRWFATRRLIPAGIPRAKRHAPVHVLCVLKARKTVVSSVDACELGCWSLSRKCSRGDKTPEKRPPFVRIKEMILIPEPAVALRLQPARASRGVRRTGQG